MEDGFYQWLNSESATPHLQRMGVDRGALSQLNSPYSGYQAQLMDWMNANPDNPSLQNDIASQYLQTLEPFYGQEQQSQRRNDDLNLALALMELGQQDIAMEILNGYGFGVQNQESATGPDLSRYGYGPQTADTQSGNLGGYQQQALQNLYKPLLESESNPKKMALYDMLLSGRPEVTSQYYEDIRPYEKLREMDFWQYLVPGGSLFQTDRKTREDRIKRAYGLN